MLPLQNVCYALKPKFTLVPAYHILVCTLYQRLQFSLVTTSFTPESSHCWPAIGTHLQGVSGDVSKPWMNPF